MAEYIHTSVMPDEVLNYLSLTENASVVDATCGEGGHSLLIAQRIPKGRLICIDRCDQILESAKERLSGFSNIDFVCARFHELDEIFVENAMDKADAILADLGISMFHLKTPGFGISYTDQESLDMRLDDSTFLTAKTLVNTFVEKEIADILYKYGEEYESRRIARMICESRPIRSASQLADIIRRSKHRSESRVHPATKSFQALRIFLNKELEILESFIPVAVDKLRAMGRLVVISFHSLEDRIVKNAFKTLEAQGKGEIMTSKPVTATDEEVRRNPASRSAKLRCFRKREDDEVC